MPRTPLYARLRSIAEGIPTSAGSGTATAAVLGGRSLGRRQLLSGASALFACSGRAPPDEGASSIVPHRIAIVGAGLAGLSCAYFLMRGGVEATLYEAGNRLGGRVFTLRNEWPEPLISELGGEFIALEHASLFFLAAALGITLEPQDQAAEKQVFWVGERRVPEALVRTQLQEVLPVMIGALEAAEANEWALAELDGTPLSRWFESNISRQRYPDLFALLQTAFRSEFGLEVEQQSALNLGDFVGVHAPSAPLGVTGDGAPFRAREGNDSFTKRLAERLGDRILRGRRLWRVRASASSYLLGFESPTGVGSEVHAERIVFAIPFSVLRDVRLESMVLQKQALIGSMRYGTHTKLVGAFTSRAWRDEQRVLTDLPLQLVWDSSAGQHGSTGILTNLVAGVAGAQSGVSADQHLLGLLPDLNRVLTTTLDYVPGSARRMHWPSAPLSRGSVSCPTWGQWREQRLAGRPEGNLHFCGEHTSLDFRGSMEGAAESGALVAAQVFQDLGVPLPAELRALIALKSSVPQAYLRDDDPQGMGPLTRKRSVFPAHREFVAGLSNPSPLPE